MTTLQPLEIFADKGGLVAWVDSIAEDPFTSCIDSVGEDLCTAWIDFLCKLGFVFWIASCCKDDITFLDHLDVIWVENSDLPCPALPLIRIKFALSAIRSSREIVVLSPPPD